MTGIGGEVKATKRLIGWPLVVQEDPAESAVRRVHDRLIEDGLSTDGHQAGHLIHGCKGLIRVCRKVLARGGNGSLARLRLVDAEERATREGVANDLEAAHCVEPAAGTGTKNESGGHESTPTLVGGTALRNRSEVGI